jgi:hypothetical protein
MFWLRFKGLWSSTTIAIYKNNDVRRGRGKRISCEYVYARQNKKKINEIFEPKKIKKYRSLGDIRRVTIPINPKS